MACVKCVRGMTGNCCLPSLATMGQAEEPGEFSAIEIETERLKTRIRYRKIGWYGGIVAGTAYAWLVPKSPQRKLTDAYTISAALVGALAGSLVADVMAPD